MTHLPSIPGLSGFFVEPVPFVEPEPETPCYGPCAECPRVGEVWQRGTAWVCEGCRDREVPHA